MRVSQRSPWERPKRHFWLIFWYVTAGFVHELTHLLVALAFGQSVALTPGFWYHLLVGRQLILPGESKEIDDSNEWFIRNSGWFASLLWALWVEWSFIKETKKHNYIGTQHESSLRWAVWVTAMEALWTDLLQFPTMPILLGHSRGNQGMHPILAFSCGNFGMILLHHAWWKQDNGNSALDILEKMIQVTMMRGAQSGGVICFHPVKHNNGHDKKILELCGQRSRVVNKKRTDLSLLVRRKVNQDNFGFRKAAFPEDYTPVFSGHTRFATSSKASFEGTHPHQWVPPSPRRVYALGESDNSGPQTLNVENYITHNGDFDFYRVNGRSYDLETIQGWLERVLYYPMPASVDSAAVAGMIDLLRTQGCFGLSARYAVCLGLPTSSIDDNEFVPFPTYSHFEEIGKVFENVMSEMIEGGTSMKKIDESASTRDSFAWMVVSKLQVRREELFHPLLTKYIPQDDGEAGESIFAFCAETIRAFFDHDLLETTKTFLANAVGSFGLCVTSSLDANKQICLAARGQTMSLAFYPRKGMILYASEQAAVKAGLAVEFPGKSADLDASLGDVDNDALRLDLDDLGGEVILLDYCRKGSAENPKVSFPNRPLPHHKLMNGVVTAVIHKESKTTREDPSIFRRMTLLSRNNFVKPLPTDSEDLILKDIQDIPRICAGIQDDWDVDRASTSLNRFTAHTLSRCLRKHLEARVAGTRGCRAVDILLTGCEVSLWLAEQFASDLQKAFPGLHTIAVSSNKLLGLYGQDTAVPAFGFPYSPGTYDLHDTIVIIVSHSGGTFAPLSCSNLMQSASGNIFVVTSEWDTQIGKQLRAMDALTNGSGEIDQHFSSRIFSTEIGVRPAEPCSLSVVATHQLLTNLFEYISAVILSDLRYRHATAATLSEQDLHILERCNRENVAEALVEIVGTDYLGCPVDDKVVVEQELRKMGDLWAEHILENARAYIMTFVYIFVTVISGYPLAFAISCAGAGLDKSNSWVYLIHLIDAAIYFWLPQINIIILRLVQGRNLRHRMVGRTVVIGDIPWVAQSAEAFLSKIFAVSYSIAGLNVLSGNPVDHFVHRHTHRVVRGSLVICGRPDGRLSALSTAEAAVCLSVNQASSIQSWGGTCESITIGHNPFKLPLSYKGIFLKRKRPVFLCERILLEADRDADTKQAGEEESEPPAPPSMRICLKRVSRLFSFRSNSAPSMDDSLSFHKDTSVNVKVHRRRSAAALMGKFKNFDEAEEIKGKAVTNGTERHDHSVDGVVASAIKERKWSDRTRKIFEALDTDEDGMLSLDEFVNGAKILQAGDLTDDQLIELFRMADRDSSNRLDYHDFLSLMKSSLMAGIKIPPSHRDERGLIRIEPSREKYFGELMRKYNAGKEDNTLDFAVARSQETAMQLYETRIASMQRFVAMVVMFHQMGKRVETFFEFISFGFWGYRMDRTHSIMRIATTASPVSGADVRDRMHRMKLLKTVKHSLHVISMAYIRYKEAKKAYLSSVDESATASDLDDLASTSESASDDSASKKNKNWESYFNAAPLLAYGSSSTAGISSTIVGTRDPRSAVPVTATKQD